MREDRHTKRHLGGECRVCGDHIPRGKWAMYSETDETVAHKPCALGAEVRPRATQAERVSRREEARRRARSKNQAKID